MKGQSEEIPNVAIATRTLLAAGFNVIGSETHPSYKEIYCERISSLGAVIRYVFAFTQQEQFTDDQVSNIDASALREGRAAVYVGPHTGQTQIGWEVFLNILGGAIPSWRALGPNYDDHLITASLNQLPKGLKGEAWQLFEELVADGLEFCFGRRVRRFGGKKRGQAVSDMVARFPDLGLEVVDAKAARNGFDAQWQNLRPLVEYTITQKRRQGNLNEVFGSVVVSSTFRQDADALSELSKRFYSETSVNLAFLTATTLREMVNLLKAEIDIRNGVNWKLIFASGIISITAVGSEIEKVKSERYPRDVD